MNRFLVGLALIAFGFVSGYAYKATKNHRVVHEEESDKESLNSEPADLAPSQLESTTTTTTTLADIQSSTTTTPSVVLEEKAPPTTLQEITTTSMSLDVKEVGGNSFRPWLDPQKAFRDWKTRPVVEILAHSRSILGYSLKPNFVRNFTGNFEGQFTANEKRYALRVEMAWSPSNQIEAACVAIFSQEKRVVFGSLGTSDLNIFQSKEAKNMLILDLPKTYAVELYLKRPGEFSVLLSFITNKTKGTKTEVNLRELLGRRNPKLDNCSGLARRL
jgi:hypothetical protein